MDIALPKSPAPVFTNTVREAPYSKRSGRPSRLKSAVITSPLLGTENFFSAKPPCVVPGIPDPEPPPLDPLPPGCEPVGGGVPGLFVPAEGGGVGLLALAPAPELLPPPAKATAS